MMKLMKLHRDNTQAIFPWLIGFFIWPMAAFIGSWKFVGQRIFSLLLILFYGLYGFTYVIAGKDQDTFRTSRYFIEASKLSFNDLLDKISNVYTIGSKPDVFQDILQFLVSRFTDNIQVYFAVTAVIFAVFAARTFEVVFKSQQPDQKHFTFFILLAGLFLLVVFAPGRINSFRHYLAGAIFISFAYSYLTEGGVKNLLYLLVTPLIHFGFVLLLPVVLIFFMVGRYLWICYGIVFLSFIFSADSVGFLQEYLSGLDENAFQYHANAYTSDVYLDQVKQLKVQRYFILDKYLYFSTVFFVVLTLYHAKFLQEMDGASVKLFTFSLLMFSFVNFFSELESVANRFGVLYHGFCCAFLIRFYLLSDRTLPKIIKIVFVIFFMVNAVIAVRLMMQSASVSTITLLFPISVFYPIEVSLLDLFK